MVKTLPANAEDMGLITGSGRSPGGHNNPLQYFCLKNPMDRGATVHRVINSWTQLKRLRTFFETLIQSNVQDETVSSSITL